MSNVGFIGLGIMGKPMATNVMKGGHTLHLYSRSGVPPELTAAGGIACAAQQLFSACQAQGGGKWDHSAMVKALEALASHAVHD